MKKFTFTVGTGYTADGSGIYWSNEEERRHGVGVVLQANGATGWTILPTSGGWVDASGVLWVEEGLRIEVLGEFVDAWGECVALQLAEYYQQTAVVWEVCEVRASFAETIQVRQVERLADAIEYGAGKTVRCAPTGTLYFVEWATGTSARLRNLSNGRTVGVSLNE
ncbi:MAG: hypothetical protein II217_04285 [Alistipes sp.]|nr:hypothetical protein [Alistipes sp.]